MLIGEIISTQITSTTGLYINVQLYCFVFIAAFHTSEKVYKRCINDL